MISLRSANIHLYTSLFGLFYMVVGLYFLCGVLMVY